MRRLLFNLSVIALALFHAAPTLQAQVGDNFCNPVIIGVLPTGTPFSFSDNNFDSGSEPDIWPDCGGGNNTRYYFFRLPAGFTNVNITLIPNEARAFQMALLDSSVCFFPGPDRFVPGTDQCGAIGETISIPSTGVCLDKGAGFILKVSGMMGNYNVILNAIAPSCSDGCSNGMEIGVDSVAPPDIISSVADSVICAGDLVLLQVDNSAVFTSIIWDDGSTGPFRSVNRPGDYSASVINAPGCSALAKIRLFYDLDCVWPGDADLNRTVQARDILPIGIAYNRTGPSRSTGPITPLTFLGQFAPDWPFFFPGVYSGINFKHADADGNGAINDLDVAALSLNYGLEVPTDLLTSAGRTGEWARASAVDPPLFITFEQDSVEAGDTLRGTVHSGTPAMPVNDLYGYGVNLTLPMAFIDSTYFEIDFSPSWLNDDGDVSSFHQFVPAQGIADIGYTRTDQTSRTGSGPLFDFGVIVVYNLDGARVTKVRQLPFNFQDLLALDPGADSVLLSPVPDTATALSYCDSRGLNSASEYIDAILVNGKTVNSGNNGGYRHLIVTSSFLKANTNYTLGFRPGFAGAPVNEHWRAWLDINGDGDFDDPGELLVNRIGNNLFQRPVFVPDTAFIGWTYLRVQMKREDGMAPEACEDFGFGEVEDYFVEIRPSGPRLGAPDGKLQIWPNPAKDRVRIAAGLSTDQEQWRELRLIHASGQTMLIPIKESSPVLQLDLGGLPRGIYTVQLLGETGVWTGKLVLMP